MDAFKTLVGGEYLGVLKDEQNEQLLSMNQGNIFFSLPPDLLVSLQLESLLKPNKLRITVDIEDEENTWVNVVSSISVYYS